MAVSFPSSYTAAQAIALCRNRTGQTAGQPTDAVIQSFLNAGLEAVERALGGVYASVSVPISANQSSLGLPSDIMFLMSLSFSFVPSSSAGATLYPIRIVEEGAFERLTAYTPVTSSGFPTLAYVTSDANQTMQLSLYPAPVSSGYINLFYRQRPQVFTDTASSSTQLDSVVMEAVIAWACRAICENRNQYGAPVAYWNAQYERTIETLREDWARRTSSAQVVADVTNTPGAFFPTWVDW
jgi:hypothetical protein